MNRHEYERAARDQAARWRRDAERDAVLRTAGEPAADTLLRSVREARRDALTRAAAGRAHGHGIRALGRRLLVGVVVAFTRPGRPTRRAQPGSSRPIESVDTGR